MALPKTDNEVPPVSAQTASSYVRQMVALEEIRTGNKETALHALANNYGLGFWQLTHLYKRKAKTCDVSLFARIKTAYLDVCASMIANLQHEMTIEEAVSGDAHDEDLVAAAAALASKVAAQRAALSRSKITG